MMKEIMGQVIADIPEYATTEDGSSSVPIVTEKIVGQPVEGSCQHDKQGRWHDEPKLVHGEIMVYTMEDEVKGDTNTIIRKIPN